MNHLLDDTELDRDEVAPHGDREISLGPGTILGIFFALAIVCGAFLGLGYSMGRHAAQNAPKAVMVSDASPAVLPGTKPAAGSAAVAKPEPADTVRDDMAAAPAPRGKATAADAAIVGDKIASKSSTTPAPSPAPALTPTPTAAASPAAGAPAGALPEIAPNGTFMVQVAAVSSKDIADIELAALKRFNYAVVVRHEPQDQLLHIQIGPFATKKDAEAMRQNVLSHGFNAIVKQ